MLFFCAVNIFEMSINRKLQCRCFPGIKLRLLLIHLKSYYHKLIFYYVLKIHRVLIHQEMCLGPVYSLYDLVLSFFYIQYLDNLSAASGQKWSQIGITNFYDEFMINWCRKSEHESFYCKIKILLKLDSICAERLRLYNCV